MRRKLLLIEDDAGIAAMLPAALRPLGYEVFHAGDSRAAAEAASRCGQKFDVVLCDVLLPDGPGTRAVEAARRYCPDAWTIFTSGYPMDVLTERGWLSIEMLDRFGASFLPKPFLPRDVHRMIERASAMSGRGAVGLEMPIPIWRRHAGTAL